MACQWSRPGFQGVGSLGRSRVNSWPTSPAGRPFARPSRTPHSRARCSWPGRRQGRGMTRARRPSGASAVDVSSSRARPCGMPTQPPPHDIEKPSRPRYGSPVLRQRLRRIHVEDPIAERREVETPGRIPACAPAHEGGRDARSPHRSLRFATITRARSSERTARAAHSPVVSTRNTAPALDRQDRPEDGEQAARDHHACRPGRLEDRHAPGRLGKDAGQRPDEPR